MEDEGPKRVDLLPRQFVRSHFGTLLEEHSSEKMDKRSNKEDLFGCHLQRSKNLLLQENVKKLTLDNHQIKIKEGCEIDL